MQKAEDDPNASLQREEIEVITSIYNDCFEVTNDAYGESAAILRHVPSVASASEHFKLVMSSCTCASERGDVGCYVGEIAVTSLPPITLLIRLPCGYPLEKSPELDISCVWLSKRTRRRLLERLSEVCEEARSSGNGALFAITSFIQSELLDYVGMNTSNEFDLSSEFSGVLSRLQSEEYGVASGSGVSNGNGDTSSKTMSNEACGCACKTSDSRSSSTVQCKTDYGCCSSSSNSGMSESSGKQCSALHGVVMQVKQFDKRMRDERFRNSRLECPICTMEVLGSETASIDGCWHVFCRECVSLYVKKRVEDGNVLKIECPWNGCEETVSEYVIRQVLTEEMLVRYEARALEQTLETMVDMRIQYCPRSTCGSAVLMELNSKGQFDTVAVCPSCSFAFCTNCQQSNHGIRPCNGDDVSAVVLLKDGEDKEVFRASYIKFLELYMNTNGEERKKLVATFGIGTDELRSQVELAAERLVMSQARFRVEQAATELLLSQTTKACPRCRTAFYKEGGCNKVHCVRCGTTFCYACFATVKSYDHFNARSNSMDEKSCPLWSALEV